MTLFTFQLDYTPKTPKLVHEVNLHRQLSIEFVNKEVSTNLALDFRSMRLVSGITEEFHCKSLLITTSSSRKYFAESCQKDSDRCHVTGRYYLTSWDEITVMNNEFI